MGRRGPAPTPSGVLAMRGTWRADRHGDPATEPDLELVDELPKPPGFLDRVGKFEWHRVGPQLVENKLLAVTDMAAFTAYCIAVSRVAACEKILKGAGLTIETPQGFIQARPEVSMSRQYGAEIRKFSQEFGLTPSARTRVRTPEKKPAKVESGWGKVKATG